MWPTDKTGEIWEWTNNFFRMRISPVKTLWEKKLFGIVWVILVLRKNISIHLRQFNTFQQNQGISWHFVTLRFYAILPMQWPVGQCCHLIPGSSILAMAWRFLSLSAPGRAFPLQPVSEAMPEMCEGTPAEKNAQRDIDIQWYSHSIDIQWYSHSLFMSVPYFSYIYGIYGDWSFCCLDYRLIGSCPAIANEAISWNGTEGRLLRLFLLFSILDTVGLMNDYCIQWCSICFVWKQAKQGTPQLIGIISPYQFPSENGLSERATSLQPGCPSHVFLQLRDVQSQMRRCEQRPEDFEDVDALWGCAPESPELLWVDGMLFCCWGILPAFLLGTGR